MQETILLLNETRSILDSNKESWTQLGEDVVVSSCKFFLTCASQVTEAANADVNLPQTADLYCQYLQHGSLSVRQHTLQYISDHRDVLCLAEDGITKLVVNLASSEVDENVLVVLYPVLTKVVNMQCLCKGSCSELYRKAMHLVTRKHVR